MESISSSFRDPSGFVFRHDGEIYRQVNKSFSKQFEACIENGLYDALISRGLLIPHEEVTDQDAIPRTDACSHLIKPKQVPYISYPYEWCFSQLKDAAILTLKVQAQAMKYGFSLKDASAYNIQFIGNKPIFIDSLSFEPYVEGKPWVAYRQFCQHFLAPLALIAYVDADFARMLAVHIDGIPLPLASKLLPIKTRINYGLLVHLHLHARAQTGYADLATDERGAQKLAGRRDISKTGIRAIIESLAKAIDGLKWKLPDTEWGDYYAKTNYVDEAVGHKRELVDLYLRAIPKPLQTIQDLGANTGEFSRIAAGHGELIISQDIDPVAVERNYLRSRSKETTNILPLVQNLIAPSPSIGWANQERDSFVERASCDALLALALIHHLAISNNTPLRQIAELFASMTSWLIIEFVPKSDSQVARLLATREDIFPDYTEQGFEAAFGQYFTTEKREMIHSSNRSLYLMKRK